MLDQKVKDILQENFGKLKYSEIAPLVGLTPRMVRYHCRKTLRLQSLRNLSDWVPNEITIMKEHYEHNPNIYKLLPNRSKQAIWYKAWELGLKSDGKGEIEGNIFFFRTWSKEMAYILGLICSDGNVCGDVLTIVQKNKEYLEQIAKMMEFHTLKIGTRIAKLNNKEYEQNRLVIRNRILVEDLKKLGVMERKSLKLGKIPVPEKFMPNFILGYFDGDGCFTYSFEKRNGKVRPHWELLGTYNFLNWIQNEISNLIKLPNRKVRKKSKKDKISILAYGNHSHIKILCDWLYRNNSFYLMRKYDKYQSYLRIYDEQQSRVYNTQVPSIGG